MGVIVSLAGFIVVLGWVWGIDSLTRILPWWVTMKFTTAVSFILCGISLYLTARLRKGERDTAVLAIPIISMVLLLLMATLLASNIIGINLGVEEMFVKEKAGAIKTVAPGRPSVATMANFILIAMSGIIAVLNPKRVEVILSLTGSTVGLLGLIAVFGYVLDKPSLYFLVEGKSTAMAAHTALLFVVWGLGLILIKRNVKT
jgi:hypothetical protein